MRRRTTEEARSVKPYLYARELASLTPWSVEQIDKMTADGTLKLGVHYFQPGGRGSRRIFKWEAIVELIEAPTGAPTRPPLTTRPRGARRLDDDWIKRATELLQREIDRIGD